MTHKQRVLQLLSDHQAHSHHELYALGCVAHSRISDLRRDGHTIEQWRDGDLYLYRLLNEVQATPPAAEASCCPPSSPPAWTSLSTPASNPAPSSLGAAVSTAQHSDRDGAGVLTLFEVATTNRKVS